MQEIHYQVLKFMYLTYQTRPGRITTILDTLVSLSPTTRYLFA